MNKWCSSALSMAFVFGGCTLVPDYKRPVAPVSTNWPANATLGTGTNTVAAADLGWHQFFEDPRLQRLIEIALKNNRDLRLAALRVEQTRAQYRIQRAELYPGVEGHADYTRQRFSGAVTTFGGGSIFTTWNLDVGASYELDLFGRIRSLKREALEKYLST
jgi:outer membrane protein, multidrug efflux system